MSKWSDYGKKVAGDTGGKFIRVKDGEAVQFVVMDAEPGERHQLFPSEEEAKRGVKPQDVSPGTPGARVTIGVAVYGIVAKAPQILQLTRVTFVKLTEKLAKFGDDRIFELSRKGSGLSTEYTIDHIGPMTDAQKATVAREMPCDLVESGFTVMQLGAPAERQPGEEVNADGIPF